VSERPAPRLKASETRRLVALIKSPIDVQLPILGPAHARTTHVHDELSLLLVSSLERSWSCSRELFAVHCSFSLLVPVACSDSRAKRSGPRRLLSPGPTSLI
jgi:hypothetical protein